jgi:hypothetical protein
MRAEIPILGDEKEQLWWLRGICHDAGPSTRPPARRRVRELIRPHVPLPRA